jgi:multiple sugar transport system substrate-binding protein
VHLVGAGHSPDIEFFPYLWILGGEILQQREGHPTKGVYWFPRYNDTKGVKALEFIKDQLDAGVKPQKEHFWGKEFLNRKFAVMIEALQNHVHLNMTEQKEQFEQKVGFIPGFPVPAAGNQSATLLGGWLLSVPSTSKNKVTYIIIHIAIRKLNEQHYNFGNRLSGSRYIVNYNSNNNNSTSSICRQQAKSRR